MTNLSDEQLSSLLDGELDDTQQRHAIDALGRDSKAREQWHRLHLARDVMHGNLPDGIDLQFSSRVMAAIDDEPAILSPATHNASPSSSAPVSHGRISSSFSKRFAGLAVAASVAAVAVMGVESLYRDDPSAPAKQQVATAAAPQSEFVRLAKQPLAPAATLASINASAANPVTTSGGTGVLVVRQDGARRIDPRLHKYLINHSQQAARANVQGVMPYARIVTYPGAHQPSVQR